MNKTVVEAREVPADLMILDGLDRWFGHPGDMVRTVKEDGSTSGFSIACPRCGRFGAITFDPSIMPSPWRVTGGNVENVTTLTVRDSILTGCCGWHGYLTDGIFESC